MKPKEEREGSRAGGGRLAGFESAAPDSAAENWDPLTCRIRSGPDNCDERAALVAGRRIPKADDLLDPARKQTIGSSLRAEEYTPSFVLATEDANDERRGRETARLAPSVTDDGDGIIEQFDRKRELVFTTSRGR